MRAGSYLRAHAAAAERSDRGAGREVHSEGNSPRATTSAGDDFTPPGDHQYIRCSMANDPYADRRRLTFEQAEGAEPLPTQLRTKELSQQLRSRLWMVVYESMKDGTRRSEFGGGAFFTDQWRSIFYNWHALRANLMADDFVNDANTLTRQAKAKFSEGDYVEIFGFLQFILRERNCPHRLPKEIGWALRAGHAAYRLLEEKTIVPISAEPELLTLQRAFADLAASEFYGARSHLHAAGVHLTAGNYASSVRDSVHAVELVARTLAPSGQLSEALTKLETSLVIHPALRKGFGSIYGYTSDEKGIRHPLLDGPQANVDEADALFMIGACAAFVSYMIYKARSAGLLKKRG